MSIVMKNFVSLGITHLWYVYYPLDSCYCLEILIFCCGSKEEIHSFILLSIDFFSWDLKHLIMCVQAQVLDIEHELDLTNEAS